MNSKVKQGILRNAALLSAGLLVSIQPTTVLASVTLSTPGPNDNNTVTPIKHVIVVVGENRSFDHAFATYVPPAGQTVNNLLSEGIVNANGTPGLNFGLAAQNVPNPALLSSTYPLGFTAVQKTAYTTLPAPQAGGNKTATDTAGSPFATIAGIENYAVVGNANNLPYVLPQDLNLLTTGATGLKSGATDTRINNVNSLPSGPFQLTPGVPYDAYAASPVHRFYQMWQQLGCNTGNITSTNPTGCAHDLFAWVEQTVGAGSNGKAAPAGGYLGEGSTALGFYNVQNGDVPVLTSLAKQYAIADNYHQPFMGGTGADSLMLGSGDPYWYSDGNGNATTPPANEIENPNPQYNTANYYTQDGYSGGTYSNCSDTTQPGVNPVTTYLTAIGVNPHCDPGHYYLLNNYDPGYYGDGSVDSPSNPKWGVSNNGFVIPPSSTPTIGEKLSANGISWAYYGEGWNAYKANPTSPYNVYCNICNPFLYSTAIMTNPSLRANLKDTSDLDNDLINGTLPAVSYVKPGGLLDGHPASSKFDLFEAFVKRLIQKVQSNPTLWKSTAILITFDEGGGYYDSGYTQPLDFFGDGTRIPLIVVSPYSTANSTVPNSKAGRVVHTYYDHVSFIKFVEANWTPLNGQTLSSRSRDNYANPVQNGSNPYIPTNGPAIGNLMDMFQFPTQPKD
jgi:phospholipase C